LKIFAELLANSVFNQGIFCAIPNVRNADVKSKALSAHTLSQSTFPEVSIAKFAFLVVSYACERDCHSDSHQVYVHIIHHTLLHAAKIKALCVSDVHSVSIALAPTARVHHTSEPTC